MLVETWAALRQPLPSPMVHSFSADFLGLAFLLTLQQFQENPSMAWYGRGLAVPKKAKELLPLWGK